MARSFFLILRCVYTTLHCTMPTFQVFTKTDLLFTSSMVGLRENGVFLYTASKILAFTWLLSIWIYLRFLNMSYVMISYQYIDNDETFITDCHTCDIESQSRTLTTTSSSSSSCLKESWFWSNYDDAEHNEDNENKREPATWTTQQAIVEAATASL